MLKNYDNFLPSIVDITFFITQVLALLNLLQFIQTNISKEWNLNSCKE